MALLGKQFDEGYTRTGQGMFSRWASNAAVFFSFIPLIGPPLGRFFSVILGSIGTIADTFGQLFRGNVGSALTEFAGGATAVMVNAADAISSSIPLVGGVSTWWLQAVSGLTTGGNSLGDHARKLTETAIGAVTGALGMKPEVLRSHPAAIGYLNPNYYPQAMGLPQLPQPGRFATMEAQRRGQDPATYHQSKMRGDEMQEHTAALEAARAQQPDYRYAG